MPELPVRYIAEIEETPGNWIKLNNGKPLRTSYIYTYYLYVEKSDRYVKGRIQLNHNEKYITREEYEESENG